MPEMGEYWYDRHGGAEVVQILAADDEEVAFMVVNTILRPPDETANERIVVTETDTFLEEYQQSADVAWEWLNPGSIWFDRRDASRRVVIEEPDEGEDDEDEHDDVEFRALVEGGVGPVQAMPRDGFTSIYVRVDDDDAEYLTTDRYVVIGPGIRSVFVALLDARAHVFETAALLNLPPGSIQILGSTSDFGVRAQGSAADPAGGSSVTVGTFTEAARGGSSPARATGVGGSAPGMILATIYGAGGSGGGATKAAEPERRTLWDRLTEADD